MIERMPEPDDKCLANGARCDTCVRLAVMAMGQRLIQSGIDQGEAGDVARGFKLRAPVEEVSGVEALSCSARQERAKKIGTEAGQNFIRRQEP